MPKNILITGATDGIGLETARQLASSEHRVILHGRNPVKLDEVKERLRSLPGSATFDSYVADLSLIGNVTDLADQILDREDRLDVLINNAGVFRADQPITEDGFDVRFAVNTIAPYLLTQRIMPLLGSESRVINLSSAAQAPVDLEALAGHVRLADMEAYAQSKLALTMWSRHLAGQLGDDGPAVIAVNPGSLLATNMVRDAFGVAGNDIGIGADILIRASLSDEFSDVSGSYYDNDSHQFAAPHPDALDDDKNRVLVARIESIIVTRLRSP